MGLVQKLETGRKQCRSLFWRMRASVKKAVKKWGRNRHPSRKFQYDPCSYALNFDDGFCPLVDGGDVSGSGGGGGIVRLECCYPLKIGINVEEKNLTIWVYVVWVDSFSS